MKRIVQSGCLCLIMVLPKVLFAQTATIAQTPYIATPAHMWEFGLHGGTAMGFGDLDPVPGIGVGFHVRRAIDYVFSLRGEGFYGKLKQENDFDGTSESTVQSGSIQLLASINNLVWNNVQRRKTNLYAFVGGGVIRFEVDATETLSSYLKAVKPTIQTQADFGIGIAFRLSSRFNLGLESKAMALFGKDSDLLDGVARQTSDVMGYGSVRLNFNIGNPNTKAEPLYWVNPMDIIMQDITELKKRPVFDATDSDADGVIDVLDQDNTTPAGVVVDTRGLPLDSDSDGIPNFQDDEPYLPKSSKVVTRREGEKPMTSEEDVRKVVEDELQKIVNGSNERPKDDGKPVTGKTEKGGTSKGDNAKGDIAKGGKLPIGSGITEWFLPIVHFNIDSYKIRYADYGNLASIARVMKSNPSLQLVVTGFTDKTASDQYNLELSYQRAKAVIEHLVSIHGIARSRFLLNYNGEDYPLVPSTGSTLMNRRVEFRAASNEDTEMENPMPAMNKGSKKGGF